MRGRALTARRPQHVGRNFHRLQRQPRRRRDGDARRDASGNFSAGTITADLSGNTTTATTASAVSTAAGDSVVAAVNASTATVEAARLPSTLATQNGANTFGGTNTFSTSPTFSAGLSAGGQKITNVGTPTSASDAATKAYVDAAASSAGSVQLAPAAQQTTSSTNHLVNLKLVSTDPVNHRLGAPGVNALLSLSASGLYPDNQAYDKERFRVDNDGSILSVADYSGGVNTTAPVEGAGTRFMWYAAKAAIRAGQINGTQWDDANIGLYSTAFGENVRALGDNAIVVGKNSVAANTGTVALGEGHTATGANSVALGYGASTSTINGSPRTGTFVFSEGTPLQPAGGVTPPAEHGFLRRLNSGRPRDTDNNSADFAFVSTDGGQYDGAQSVLGAPGPQNTESPTQRNARIKASLIDPQQSNGAPPNSVRKQCTPNESAETCDPAAAKDGTFSIRRRWTNNTGANVTALRFRIVDVTTLNSPGNSPDSSPADLRALSSLHVAGGVTLTNGTTVAVEGTTLEAPSSSSPGGGLNSTLAAGTISVRDPLVPNESINLQFLLGVVQPGSYRFFINVEAGPALAGPLAPVKATSQPAKGGPRAGAPGRGQ